MDFLRSALPHGAIIVGLLATAVWMGLLGYGTFQIAKWTLLELAELLL